MRGVAKGEQCTTTNPLLVLFCRSGERLTDLVSGSYRIIDRTTTPATEKVPPTALGAAQKLGTGRYALVTGATSAWNIGTHTAICTYTMSAGGKTYTQSIDFEVLDSSAYPSGEQYVGYVTSFSLVSSGAFGTMTPAQLHAHIDFYSREVEAWTRRFFEPRYMAAVLSGEGSSSVLRLEEAIIAAEKVEALAKYPSGEEWAYEYNTGCYAIYNRHLDGLLSPDDRRDPKIELINDIYYANDGLVPPADGYAWPFGHQNIRITGVFGFTEPEVDLSRGRVLIGRTPRVLEQVLTALIARRVSDPTLSNPTVWSPGSIRSARTRDQAVTFGSSSSSSAGGDSGMSGDPTIDRMLLPLCAPLRIAWTRLDWMRA